MTLTKMTPNSVAVCWKSGIGSVVLGMSCSHERARRSECGLVQVTAGLAEQGGLVVADYRQVHVRPAQRRGNVVTGLSLAEAADRSGGQDELDPAVPGRGPVTGGPGIRRQRLDGLDQLPGGDDPGTAEMQQMIGLAEDMAGRPGAGQLAARCLLGQAAGDVASIVAEYRHAVAVGEERRDHQRAERAGRSRLASFQIEQL